MPYFSTGTHLAGLAAATLFTLPFAFGAGGFLYYFLRRDHRVCPRCGIGWGNRAELAFRARGESVVPAHDPPPLPTPSASWLPAWSILLFVAGAILLIGGLANSQVVPMLLGATAVTGGFISRRVENRAREERRAALIAGLQTHVVRLAGQRGGRLTVTEVSAALGWPLRRAEKVLHSLDDGWRVDSQVTDDGIIVYHFRELGTGSAEAAGGDG
jgi:hypothetical protein